MADARRYRALVTGASRGIGKAIVRALEGRCDRMFLLGRDHAALASLEAELRGTEVVILAGDVAEPAFLEQVRQAVHGRGGLNLLVNNAGVSDFHSYDSQSTAAIERMVSVNLLAPMLLTRALLPVMAKESAAQVVHVGSTFGYIGYPGYAAYCATKFGLRGFNEALGRELSGTPVRSRLFSPRATRTDINAPVVQELNRQLGTTEDDPAEVARQFVAFLERDDTEFRVGFPEKVFALLNQILPGAVSQGLRKQLPRIRQALSSIESTT